MPTRLEAARHALGPQRFPGGGQQSFLLRIHRTLLGACDACARESVLEELPAISDRGGVGGGVRAKQSDRRLRDSRAAVGRMAHGTANRKGPCPRVPARRRRLGWGGSRYDSLVHRGFGFERSSMFDRQVRSDVSTGGSGWRSNTRLTTRGISSSEVIKTLQRSPTLLRVWG